MKTSRSKRVRAIGVFIVLIAIITSFYMGSKGSKSSAVDNRDAKKIYDSLNNRTKISISISVKSLAALKFVIQSKLNTEDNLKIYSKEQSNSALYIYQVDPQSVPVTMGYLSEVGNITNSEERISTQQGEIDLENKLRDREIIYQKEFQDYNTAKVKYSYQLDRIKQLGKEVDSLKFEIANQRNKAKTILFLTARIQASNVGRVAGYRVFLLEFIKWLVIYSIAVIFMYYGTIVLMYLMTLLGIRFPSISAYGGRGYNIYAGYKGYRGYGSYGYGGSKRRKIKRIYKNRPSSDEESDENDTH